MKFKHLFLTVSVMALFSSCSNDELVSETTSHGDAIAFSVTTTNATRAADYWCNNQLPKYFEVSAAFDGKIYFQNELYKQEGSTSKYLQDDDNYRYWPNINSESPISIYAYKVKADGETAVGANFATFAWDKDKATEAPTISLDMSDKKEASKQHDLLYAYTKLTTKPAYNATTDLNFRHALSQIVFYAKCENTKVYVEIEEIALYNAAKSGVFTLPTGDNTTTPNFVEHTQAGTETHPSAGLGIWALTYDGTGEGESFVKSNNYRGYVASCKNDKNELAVLTPGAKDGWQNLTDNTNTTEGEHTNVTQSLLVLPQTDYTVGGTVTGVKNNSVKAYNPVPSAGTYKALSEVGGACIAIKCKIRNIAGASVVDNDVYLWGSASKAEYLVVPVDFAWEQGKKYIYKINFSKTGHGGFNPGDGHEVLVPIQLSVTVDDFAKVTDIEKDI